MENSNYSNSQVKSDWKDNILNKRYSLILPKDSEPHEKKIINKKFKKSDSFSSERTDY